MDTHSRERLRHFADASNKEVLHPPDWRRFFDFMIHVHRAVEPPPPEDEVHEFLSAARFPEWNSGRLASLYTHGLDLLRHYDEAPDDLA